MKATKMILTLAVALCVAIGGTACQGGKTVITGGEEEVSQEIDVLSGAENTASGGAQNNQTGSGNGPGGSNSTRSGASGSGDNKNAQASDAGKIAADPTEKPLTQQMKEKLDFKKATITLAYSWDPIPTVKTAASEREEKRIAELEAKYNCKIERKQGRATGYLEAILTTTAAGKPMGDIMMTQDGQIPASYKAGVFADLSPAMKATGIDFTNSRYSQTARKYTNINNQQVGFNAAYSEGKYNIWFYNKRIFGERGITEDPQALYAQGKWTWDKAEELAEKATKRNSGGTVESYGLGFWFAGDCLIDTIVSNGSFLTAPDANTGKAKIVWEDAKARKAIERVHKWATQNKFMKFGDGGESWDARMNDFAAGNLAILAATDSMLDIIREKGMADDFGMVYAPKGPDASDYYSSIKLGYFYFIPKARQSVANDYLLLMDDYFAPYPGMSDEDRFKERWMASFRDSKSYDIFKDMTFNAKRQKYDPNAIFGLMWAQPSFGTLVSDLYNNRITPGNIVDQNTKAYQNVINDNWKNMRLTGK